ncbi:MAG: LacI family DNA-binding transcriptional regulator [Omnitrophica WOR_2 bacterium]
MPNIREVADKAGVSFTTVSHVINNTRYVSEETRAKVMAAMEALNYRPNAVARSLKSGKTNTLGLILPDSSNPFFAEVGHCVEEAAFQLGYRVILCNTEGDLLKEQMYVEVLSHKQVDGIIFYATGDRPASIELLIQSKLPFVMVDRDLANTPVDAVLTDNCEGGLLATRHLIQLGHQQIACLIGPSDNNPSAGRVIGYRAALTEAGLIPQEDNVLRGDFHPETGRVLTLQLLSRESPPTAIFACNDMMALGALRAVYQMGLRVPENVSIIGFDGIDLGSYSNPPLTTIAQPKDRMGKQAVQLVIERLRNPDNPPQRTVFPCNLIARESTGPRFTK